MSTVSKTSPVVKGDDVTNGTRTMFRIPQRSQSVFWPGKKSLKSERKKKIRKRKSGFKSDRPNLLHFRIILYK